MEQEQCKGFWHMCRCSKCRAADRKLESDLENSTPEERRKLLDENLQQLNKARGLH